MEAKDLGILLDRIQEWPTALEAASTLTSLLRATLESPLCIFATGPSFVIDPPEQVSSFAEKLIRDRILQTWVPGSQAALEVRQIRLDHLGKSLPKSLSDLEFFGISLGSKDRFIVFASEHGLNAKEELVLISVATHLQALSIVDHLKSEIQLRSQFLSIASHELKTPLTSIYGILQLQERMLRLKRDEPEKAQLERQHSFLKMVIRQVERLNDLIDGLLDVSRIQNGRFVVEPADTDVALLLREVAQSRLSVVASEAGVNLHLDVPENLHAWVDPVRMEEVINNLIMNAIRFSPEGGVVWIKMVQDQELFRLMVRDQGPSVPLEDRERIFQPFERAQRTGRLGGLGLGLFISREIASLHGGLVQLTESVPGKGNVFEASFPIRNVKKISA